MLREIVEAQKKTKFYVVFDGIDKNSRDADDLKIIDGAKETLKKFCDKKGYPAEVKPYKGALRLGYSAFYIFVELPEKMNKFEFNNKLRAKIQKIKQFDRIEAK